MKTTSLLFFVLTFLVVGGIACGPKAKRRAVYAKIVTPFESVIQEGVARLEKDMSLKFERHRDGQPVVADCGRDERGALHIYLMGANDSSGCAFAVPVLGFGPDGLGARRAHLGAPRLLCGEVLRQKLQGDAHRLRKRLDELASRPSTPLELMLTVGCHLPAGDVTTSEELHGLMARGRDVVRDTSRLALGDLVMTDGGFPGVMVQAGQVAVSVPGQPLRRRLLPSRGLRNRVVRHHHLWAKLGIWALARPSHQQSTTDAATRAASGPAPTDNAQHSSAMPSLSLCRRTPNPHDYRRPRHDPGEKAGLGR